MKFRDEADLTVKVVTAHSPVMLEEEIRQLCHEYDLVDLQYSTTGEIDKIEYSALALVRKKVYEYFK